MQVYTALQQGVHSHDDIFTGYSVFRLNISLFYLYIVILSSCSAVATKLFNIYRSFRDIDIAILGVYALELAFKSNGSNVRKLVTYM